MPKVSVIVPVYNTSEYLGQCLETILLQTLQDIEVICVDDGSTDDSLSRLQDYTLFDSRLKVIHQENAGAAAARNRGLKEASGEFVIFLDSDDFFEATMLEKMVARAEQDNSDVVVCGSHVFDDKSEKITQTNLPPQKYSTQPFVKPDDIPEDLFIFCSPAPWNKLIRMEIIKKNELQFDSTPHVIDDIMFHCLSLACAKKISVMGSAFVYYRVNIPGQQSRSKKEQISNVLRTLSNAYENLKRLNLWDTYQLSLLNRIRYSLQIELANCNASEKKQEILAIRQNLPQELYDQVFSSTYPAISLIIPAYNAANYLSECLESVIHQTLQNIEIICVDDGSTDDTLDVLNQYAAQDNRIKVIHQENKGLAGARNAALEKATGTYIQCLDADDYLEPDACECIYTYMSIYRLEMCSIAAIEFNDQTRKEFEEPYHILQWLPEKFTPVFSYQDLLSCLPQVAVTACLTVYKRAFLIKNQISWIKKRLCYEDTPFFVEAFLKAERMGALSDKFYHRRVHSAAITQNMDSNFKDYIQIMRYTLDMISKANQKEIVLLSYIGIFLIKAWLNYSRMQPEIQIKNAPHLYDLCLYIMKTYYYLLPVDIRAWCLRYAKYKGKKELVKLKFRLLLVKLNRADYTINLIQVVRKPEVIVKILGFPVFQVVRHPMQFVEEELPVQQRVKKAEEIFYKLFGFTFLKVEKRDLYG